MNEDYNQVDLTLDGNDGVNWFPYGEYGFTSPWAPRLFRRSFLANYLISAIGCSVICIVFAIFESRCQHWCLFPIFICGVLAGADIVAWLRGEIDTFDPKALIALYLFHNCFVAPQMHLFFDIYTDKRFIVYDWGDCLGYMAFFNVAGIISYKIIHRMFFKITKEVRSHWEIESGKFLSIWSFVLGISFIASLVIRIFFGIRRGEGGETEYAAGAAGYLGQLSWLRMLGDPFVTLLAMGIIYWISSKHIERQRSLFMVGCLMLSVTIFQFIMVGTRGSRSLILVGILVVTMLVHFRLRPFAVKYILLGMCVVAVFLYLYDFRKKIGERGWEAFYSAEARKSLEYEKGGGGFKGTLLGDLARADLQAYMLHNLRKDSFEYRYRLGQTYLLSALTFVPRGIWRSKPSNVKRIAGSEIQGFTVGSSRRGSSRQYGLAGEAMLNFGYLAIVPAFMCLGGALGWFRKKLATMTPYDARIFLMPIFILAFQSMIISDSGNWTFGLVRKAFLPFILISMSSAKTMLYCSPEE